MAEVIKAKTPEERLEATKEKVNEINLEIKKEAIKAIKTDTMLQINRLDSSKKVNLNNSSRKTNRARDKIMIILRIVRSRPPRKNESLPNHRFIYILPP